MRCNTRLHSKILYYIEGLKMKLKLIFIACLLLNMLNANSSNPVSVQTNKGVYSPEEEIVVSFSNMLGDSHDWIALYKADTSTQWVNVLQWEWTDGVIDGNFTFDGLAEGVYEARAFFEDSYTVEGRSIFTVHEPIPEVNLSSNKAIYLNNEEVIINFQNMSGDSEDWIALYPKESSTAWENVMDWKFTEGDKNGSFSFEGLEVGLYEARAFFENSFISEQNISFSVIDEIPIPTMILTTDKVNYFPSENISVSFENMLGDEEDWIAIYPKGASTVWENVIEWKFTEGLTEGNITFENLPIGEYEVRAFFENSFDVENSQEFEVVALPISTLYEDAESGISEAWIHFVGNYPPMAVEGGFNSTGALALTTEWTHNGTVNIAEYYLPLHNTTQKILEMDVGGVANYLIPNKLAGQEGYMSHFGIGVTIHTLNGKRKILWDSFLNHGNVEAYRQDNGDGNIWIYFPSPVEHVRGYLNIDTHQWEHFKVDVELALKTFEPENEVTSIDFLLVTGGFLDNIKLSSE